MHDAATPPRPVLGAHRLQGRGCHTVTDAALPRTPPPRRPPPPPHRRPSPPPRTHLKCINNRNIEKQILFTEETLRVDFGTEPSYFFCIGIRFQTVGKRKGKPSILSALQKRGKSYGQKCSLCNRWYLPHHKSRVFSTGSGHGHVSLKKQAGILFCATWRSKAELVPAYIEDIGKGTVASIFKAFRSVVTLFVKKQQNDVKFGDQ